MSTLREMTWRDIPRLAELEAELFADDAWSEATWWAELAGRPRREYVVLEGHEAAGIGGGIEGYAGVDHGGEVADIMTVAVAPARRGRGDGDRLVDTLLERARDRGAGAAILEVRADNPAARGLYRRHGFEEISVRRRYYQPGDVDAVVMRRRLEGER
ncbi:MAG: ribosomal protein S18-alanine N-acetyltransferase [Lapillicoccus sp.]